MWDTLAGCKHSAVSEGLRVVAPKMSSIAG